MLCLQGLQAETVRGIHSVLAAASTAPRVASGLPSLTPTLMIQ